MLDLLIVFIQNAFTGEETELISYRDNKGTAVLIDV